MTAPATLKFTHDGGIMAFRSNMEATLGSQKVESSLESTIDAGLKAQFELKAPWCKDVVASINHQGLLAFRHMSQVSYLHEAI